MLDAESITDPCVHLIRDSVRGCGAAGCTQCSEVSIETGEFGDIIRRRWPNRASNPDQLPTNLDDYGAVQLAIALEKTGDSAAALGVLKSHKPKGTDVLGVLAGRLKKMVADQRRGRSRKRPQAVSGSLRPVRREIRPITTKPIITESTLRILRSRRSVISTLPEPWRRRCWNMWPGRPIPD